MLCHSDEDRKNNPARPPKVRWRGRHQLPIPSYTGEKKAGHQARPFSGQYFDQIFN
jgi:hypothetical protein